MRITKVTKVAYRGDYRLALEFSDGTSGIADLSADLDDDPLAGLRDKKLFAQAFLDGSTVCWPGDLDLAPEWLYARAHALPPPKTVEDVETNQTAMSLRALRLQLGVSQQQLAEILKMTQSQVSRVESRDDVLMSTLRRVVEGLGGELELTAVVGNKRMKLAL